MRTGLALVVLLLVSLSAAASVVERSSSGLVTYQFDADSHHDAPDACETVGPEWRIPVDNRTDGILVPGDDESDHYILNFTAEHLGQRFTVRLDEVSTLAGDIKASLDILMPTCGLSVLDPASQPPEHPEPGPGQKEATVANLDGPTECSTRWFFVLNGVSAATAPASIDAIWTDGYQETIPIDSAPPHPVGHYQTTSRLDTTLHSVSAIVPEGWSGNFRLGEAPCGTTHGGYAFGEPAIRMGDSIEFNVLKSGPYVVAVHLGEFEPIDVTKPMPMSCHMCLGLGEDAAEETSYTISPNSTGSEAK